jgi:hypothetical protein
MARQADGGFVSNDIHAWQIISTNWRVITTGDYNGDNRTTSSGAATTARSRTG